MEQAGHAYTKPHLGHAVRCSDGHRAGVAGQHASLAAAAALLSLTLSIGMVKSLARRGLLPRACIIVIDLGVVLLALTLTLLASPLVAFERFASLPVWLLLMCAASWPLLSAWLMRLWRDEPQRYRWSSGRSIPRYKPIAALIGRMQRYSSLRWSEDAQIKQFGIEAAKIGRAHV